ncbi:MAG TPA: hypothetical protein PKC83_10945 [Gemmatimonadaceae bacterium]|nr:hypothetical protein [Gemmatimonadaceae bacterium]
MTTKYRIEQYDGSLRPATHPDRVEYAADERAARRIAADMLGHRSLRGASTWERYQGGTVYQFGPRVEDNGYDYAVIIEAEAEAEAEADERADYDVC